jgi:signal transduction histidine kinase
MLGGLLLAFMMGRPVAAQEPSKAWQVEKQQVWTSSLEATAEEAQAAFDAGLGQPLEQGKIHFMLPGKTWIRFVPQAPPEEPFAGRLFAGSFLIDSVTLHTPTGERDSRGVYHRSNAPLQNFPTYFFPVPVNQSGSAHLLEFDLKRDGRARIMILNDSDYRALFLESVLWLSIFVGAALLLALVSIHQGIAQLPKKQQNYQVFGAFILLLFGAIFSSYGDFGYSSWLPPGAQYPVYLLTAWGAISMGSWVFVNFFSTEGSLSLKGSPVVRWIWGLNTGLYLFWIFFTSWSFPLLVVVLTSLNYLGQTAFALWAVFKRLPMGWPVLLTQAGTALFAAGFLAVYLLEFGTVEVLFRFRYIVMVNVFLIGVNYSIYDRKQIRQAQLEQRLDESRKQAYERLQQGFLSRMSPEMLRLTSYLSTCSQLLQEPEYGSSGKVPAQQLRVHLDEALQNLRLFLLIGRLSPVASAVEPCDLLQLLHSPVSNFRSRLEPGQFFSEQIPESLPLVQAHPEALQMIVGLLLELAREHSPGITTLYLGTEGVNCRVWVMKDTRHAKSLRSSIEVESKVGLEAPWNPRLLLCQRLLQEQGMVLEESASELGQAYGFAVPVAGTALVPPRPQPTPEDLPQVWVLGTPRFWTLGALQLLRETPDLAFRHFSRAPEFMKLLQEGSSTEAPPEILLVDPLMLSGAQRQTLNEFVEQTQGRLVLLESPRDASDSSSPESLCFPEDRVRAPLLLRRLARAVGRERQFGSVPEGSDVFRRQMLVQLLQDSLECWKRFTGKDKLDLLNASGIWKVHVDLYTGTLRSRVFDIYLKLETLPEHPRWQAVMNTAIYVGQLMPEDPQGQKLLATAQKLPEYF